MPSKKKKLSRAYTHTQKKEEDDGKERKPARNDEHYENWKLNFLTTSKVMIWKIVKRPTRHEIYICIYTVCVQLKSNRSLQSGECLRPTGVCLCYARCRRKYRMEVLDRIIALRG